jgi:GNAT superfamily N-acetyltransferase
MPDLIARATRQDIPEIALLLANAFASFESQYTPEAFTTTIVGVAEFHARWDQGSVWLARREGMLLGTVSAVPGQAELYIRSMAVAPEARGLGIGARLLNAVEAYAQAHALPRLYLSTTPFLSAAIRLYTAAGFQRIPDGPHDLHGTPLFSMEKHF